MELSKELSARAEELLRARVKESRNFAAIFRELARKKSFPTTDIYRLRLDLQKGGYSVTVDAVMNEFEFIQKLKGGELKRRKLPEHSVFIWRGGSSEPFVTMVMSILEPGYQKPDNYYRPTSSRRSDQAAGDGPALSFVLKSTGRELRFNLEEARELRQHLEKFAAVLK